MGRGVGWGARGRGTKDYGTEDPLIGGTQRFKVREESVLTQKFGSSWESQSGTEEAFP